MIKYPKEHLSYPQRDGYEFNAISPLQRTQLASGRARQRRRFTSVPTMVKVQWIFSKIEAQIFEAWFEDALKSGSEWFECPLLTPEGLKEYTARFSDMYNGPILLGFDHWIFNAVLEVRDRPILNPGWGMFPGFISNQSIIDKALNREWPES